MAPVPGLFLILLLFGGARAVEAVTAPGRCLEVAAVLLAFSMTRLVLDQGSPQGTVFGCAGLRAAARFLAGGEAGHCVAAGLGGGLLGIFLLLTDVLSLRHPPRRRLYNFVVVAALGGTAWYVVAVWIPHVPFPRASLLQGVLSELFVGAALGVGASLVAPGFGRELPEYLRAPTPPAEPDPDLVLGGGAGGPVLGAALDRGTLPAPPEGSEPDAPEADPVSAGEPPEGPPAPPEPGRD